LYEYSNVDLSTKPVSELARMYLDAKKRGDDGEIKKLETAIITNMERDSYRSKYDQTIEILGTCGLSDNVMLKALEIYSDCKMMDVNRILEVLSKENSVPVKKEAFDLLARKAYLHTLEEIQSKNMFRGNKELTSALDNAITKCLGVCTAKGHSATLVHSRLRLATCSG